MNGGNDLEIAVRVRADGQGLVNQLSQDEAAVRQLGTAAKTTSADLGQLAQGSQRAGQAAGAGAKGLDEQGRAAGNLEAKLAALENRYDQAGAPMRRYQADLADISLLLQREAIDLEHATILRSRATAMHNEHSKALKSGARSAGEMGAGMQQMGMQFGDFMQQASMATGPQGVLIAFSQQAGQAAYAASMLGGTAGKVGTFFAGPWGAMILAAVTVIGMLATELFKTDTAMRTVETASDALGQATSVLGGLFDEQTGKINANTEALRINARMKAIDLRAEAAAMERDAAKVLDEAGDRSLFGRLFDLTNPYTRQIAEAQSRQAEELVASVRSGKLTPEQAVQRSEGMSWDLLDQDPKAVRKALADQLNAIEIRDIAADIDKSITSGQKAERFVNPRNNRPRADNSAARAATLQEWGEDASDRIANIAGRFAGQPKLIEQAAQAMRQLDDIVDDINRKKPANLDELLADAAAARRVIQEGVNRPFNDFLESQSEAIANIRLLKNGREDEAEAARIIAQLEERMGPLTAARKDAVLASVQALRLEERQLDIIHQKQERQLRALGDVRSIISQTIYEGVEGLDDLPKRLFDSYKALLAETVTEDLFGDTFRKLEDQVTGTKIVEESSERFQSALDASGLSLKDFTSAVKGATAAAGAAPTTSPWESMLSNQGSHNGTLAGAIGALLPSILADETPIPVTASAIPKDPAGMFGKVLKDLAAGFLGKQAAEVLGSVVKEGLNGAFLGQMGSQAFTSVFGGQSSSTGAAIGGALGKFAGKEIGSAVGGMLGQVGGPLGSIVGGMLGGALGGLFKKKEWSSASVTSTEGWSPLSGNSDGMMSNARGAAGSIQDGVKAIAEQLGGSLGAFNVSIGQYKGEWRVRTDGSSKMGGYKNSPSSLYNFGEDGQAEAIAFAILDAVKDGAVTGLSAAVQQAIRSTDDVQKALAEALKVQEVEILLGGLGAELQQTFKAFEAQAKERVRIATRYGFDLVEIEKINAEERAKVFDDLLKSRIGGIQDLLANLEYGDLFEGSAVAQREKLLAESAKAKADAEAGVDGAADRYADLRRQLLDLTRDAFGTAGPEYVADREATRTEAENIIRIESERIKAAQDAAIGTKQAMDRNNQLTDETNDLLGEQTAILRQIAERGLAIGGGTFVDSVTRSVAMR